MMRRFKTASRPRSAVSAFNSADRCRCRAISSAERSSRNVGRSPAGSGDSANATVIVCRSRSVTTPRHRPSAEEISERTTGDPAFNRVQGSSSRSSLLPSVTTDRPPNPAVSSRITRPNRQFPDRSALLELLCCTRCTTSRASSSPSSSRHRIRFWKWLFATVVP